MPNPVGKNQLGAPSPYGQVKKQLELQQQAPISGAPVSGRALNTPRRGSQQAQRRPATAATVPAAAAPGPEATAEQPAPYRVQLAMIWRAAANTPGAHPIVQELAEQAEREAGLA